MPQKSKGKAITGIMSVTRRGVGYVSAEGVENDIEIDPALLNTALHGDTVAVTILPKGAAKRTQGTVTKIIERAKEQFVGTLQKESGRYLLKPDDQRMYRDIVVRAEDLTGKTIGPKTKALVRLASWRDPKGSPEGELVRILGEAGEHDVEMEAIVLERGFDATFRDEIEKEAASIKQRAVLTEQEIKKRKDFRAVTTFTIDPDDAKDFDDAVSVRTLENGNIEVGVHIADVSHFVRPGSAIDKEAQERGTSIYLVDRTIPMLPEVLSNDVCSLNPNEDKFTFSAVFELDREARVQKRWFGETVIHSDKRFTYEEAQGVLDDTGPPAPQGTPRQVGGPHKKELDMLSALATRLRERRYESGAISFEQDEVKFKLDSTGKPLEIFKKPRLDTNLLIEDFMLLANREVAEYFHQLCKKAGLREALFVYRVHDEPNIDKLEELAIFLRAIGYDFELRNGEVSGQEINALFKQIEGKPEESLIKTATIRSMAKAVYSTKNVGHFGLAFQYYTHFTSPIRRYPDVMVHRIMKSHLNGSPLTKRELRLYERLAIQSSQREIAAVEAERDSIKYKQVEYMLDKVGQTFSGIVTGVVEWGLYVEEVNTKAEGLVRVKNLADDYYVFQEKKYRLVGDKKKKTYALGDQVKMKLTAADLEERTLEWVLV